MTALAAILLCCTAGDRDVAAAIHAEAVRRDVPVALALAVGCIESGLRDPNPLGVMVPAPSGRGQVACHRTGRSAASCIAIGVVSLTNRLRGCGGDWRCAARRYNASKGKVAYASRVVRVARFAQRRSSRRDVAR
jgi:hypothetical protein